MADSYPIVQVHPEWVLEQEDMGTKEKFWYRKPELVHGNQVLEWTVGDYDPNIRFGQSDHSFENIWNSLDRVFEKREAAEETEQGIAGYLILDAVIGNTDRHHENWGLLRRRVGSRWAGRLAPSFDHASSLGRELLDRKRLQLLKERRVRQYSEKGRGGIYWSRGARYGPSPLELVRKAVAAHPISFEASLERLTDLRDALVSEIVNWVPSDWMSRSAREFAIGLITCNRNQLMELSR